MLWSNETSAVMAFYLLTAAFSVASAVASTNRSSVVYDFEKIKPSTEIQWTPCFDNFTCTRLQVPLDYENHSIGNTSIAFLKVAALKQPAEDLLVNFGGPGDSGISTIFLALDQIRQYYGVGIHTQIVLVPIDQSELWH